MMEQAPMRQFSPIVVAPRICANGSTMVSIPISTVESMVMVSGLIKVTPAAIRAQRLRSRKMASTRASCARSLMPRASPGSSMRMDNRVEAGAHIGNFVELKKTRMRAGAKAGHLAYLGDSDIGAKVNIGAGTITCNYDGDKKHPTQIGEGAFVGSNSTLVAPLEIGAGAYVAAGSVVTQTVPPDALAIGRGRQENKPEWAKKRRKLAKTVEAVKSGD